MKMNRKLILLLACALALAVFAGTVAATSSDTAAQPTTAKPTSSTVLVDGKNVAFDAYNINDNNYFKLRDLAYTLNGTAKQFSVGWDGGKDAITLTSGQSYKADGSEMTSKGSGVKEATPTTSKIYLDGKEVQFTAYKIGGYNYFKLRDIGKAFDFGVDWDGTRNTIVIDTEKGFTPEAGGDAKLVGVWEYSITTDDEFYLYSYSFGADGVFSYYDREYRASTAVSGRYTASDGKVYLYGLVSDSGDKWKDRTLEYSFGTDKNGEFLLIQQLMTMDGGSWDKVKFRRSGE